MDSLADLASEAASTELAKAEDGVQSALSLATAAVQDVKLELEKRERGIYRGQWVPYTLSLVVADGQLRYTKAGAEAYAFVSVASISKVEVMPLTEGKPFCLKLTMEKATHWLLAVPTGRDVEVLTAAIAGAKKLLNSSLVSSLVASDAADLLPDSYEEINKSLAGDVDGVMQAGESFMSLEAAKEMAGEIAGALLPALLEIADKVPFFGPIAGVLLMCHSSYVGMGKNKEALTSLQAQLDYAARLIERVAKDKSELFTEGATLDADKQERFSQVFIELKILTLAVHGTTLVINKIKSVTALKEKPGFVSNTFATAAAMALGSVHQKLIHDALDKLTAAISAFVASLANFTSMELQRGLDDLKGKLAEGVEAINESLRGVDEKVENLTEKVEDVLGRLTLLMEQRAGLEFDIKLGKISEIPLALRSEQQQKEWRNDLAPANKRLVKALEEWLREKAKVSGRKSFLYANLLYERDVDRPEKIKEGLEKDVLFLESLSVGLTDLTEDDKEHIVKACFSDLSSAVSKRCAQINEYVAAQGGLEGLKTKAQERATRAVGSGLKAIHSMGTAVSETVASSSLVASLAEKMDSSPTAAKAIKVFNSSPVAGLAKGFGNFLSSASASASPTAPSSPQPSTLSPRAAAAAAASVAAATAAAAATSDTAATAAT